MAKAAKLSDSNKVWARRSSDRTVGKRPQRRYLLIICEGRKTEPCYFESIKRELPKGVVEIEVFGAGMNTMQLVNFEQEKKDEFLRWGRPVDRIWVVFDRDSFPKDHFDNAISKSESLQFNVAWSNECFGIVVFASL